MLKGINPLLGGDLLKVLDDMGHGDQLLLVDRNYPAVSSGKPVVRLAGVGIVEAAEAILSVFPLDTFIDQPVERMEVEDDPTKVTSLQEDLLKVVQRHEQRTLDYRVVPRMDFYTRARSAYAVVHTLETQPYGCFIFHKGVIF
jgi:L-fucose mutarotase